MAIVESPLSFSFFHSLSVRLSLSFSIYYSCHLFHFLFFVVSFLLYFNQSKRPFIPFFWNIRDGTRPVGVNSVRDTKSLVPQDGGLSDRARSQCRSPTSTSPPPSPRISERFFPSNPVPPSSHTEQTSPTSPVRTAHTFGDGTCYPGCKTDLHSTLTNELSLTSPLCGLLRDLPFQEIVDLAYMFNYNDDERWRKKILFLLSSHSPSSNSSDPKLSSFAMSPIHSFLHSFLPSFLFVFLPSLLGFFPSLTACLPSLLGFFPSLTAFLPSYLGFLPFFLSYLPLSSAPLVPFLEALQDVWPLVLFAYHFSNILYSSLSSSFLLHFFSPIFSSHLSSSSLLFPNHLYSSSLLFPNHLCSSSHLYPSLF